VDLQTESSDCLVDATQLALKKFNEAHMADRRTLDCYVETCDATTASELQRAHLDALTELACPLVADRYLEPVTDHEGPVTVHFGHIKRAPDFLPTLGPACNSFVWGYESVFLPESE